ncbi:MAG: hypothetical protein U0704_18440 [Candidatus Eisenbacteria bacterium]
MKSNKLIASALILGATILALTSCGKTTTAVNSVTPPPTLDTTPPAAPTGVHGWYDPAANRDYLSWTLSSSADVLAYEVYIVPSGGSPSLIETLDATQDVMALPVRGTDGNETYRVRAVDASGNTSAYSSSVIVTRHGYDGGSMDGGGDGRGIIVE